jgi:hypothetical protein
MTISSEIELLANQVANVVDAINRLAAAQNSETSCCPEMIYDCETGNVRWVWPPAYSADMDGSVGDIIIDDTDTNDGAAEIGPDGTIGGYDGDAGGDFGGGGDFGIGYDDPGVNPPESTGCATWNEYDDALCLKANWTVLAAREALEQMLSISGWVANGVASMQTLIGVLGAVGLVGDTLAGVAIGASALTMSVPVAVAGAIVGLLATLVAFGAKATIMAQYDDMRFELVCAIYRGKSPAGIKARWDQVVTAKTTWFAPQRALLRYLMYPDLARGIAYGHKDAVIDKPRYDYNCSLCSSGGYPKVAIWKSYDGGSTWVLDAYSRYYYIWPDGEGVAEVGDEGCPWNATRFTFTDSSSEYDPTCRRNHNGDLNGYRIRETTGVGASFRANTNPPYCDSWGLALTIPSDGSWLNINQSTENANIWRGDNGDFNIEIEVQP